MTELEKLQKAAALIEDMAEGAQTFGVAGGTPQLFTERIAGGREKYPPVSIRMTRVPLAGEEGYKIGFRAHLETAGPPMDADALHGFGREIRKARTLLRALEAQTFTPTKEEFARFAEWLGRREAPETSLEENIGPVMGQQGGAL